MQESDLCPGQWTVVGIALGVGAGEGARPLPAQAGPGEAFMEILGEMLHYRTNSSNIVHAIVAARALARKVYDCYPSLHVLRQRGQ
ncbi:hypothetical protein MBOURGENBZM_15630 [Methanoculleus bourgensis]|nr:hypothetical protein MBOURGENBZM_15630 [Methanoculleus bourgensis]